MKYPEFMGAVIAVNLQGEVGAACHGIGNYRQFYQDYEKINQKNSDLLVWL